MASEIIMPKAGMDMEEGTIVKWLVEEGEQVDTGDPILEIITDKVNMEVEAEESGTILKIIGEEGAVLPVFTVIGYIGEEGEEVPDAPAQPKEAKEEKKESKPSKAAEDSDEYDVVVLGAGPGGYVAAIRAAQLGGKVAIVEKDYFGGTCLNVGCIPTKTLVKSAEILHGIDQGKARGITVGDVNIDMKKVKQNKDQVVKNLTGGIQNLLKSNKVDIFDGLGTVKAGDKVTITDGKDSGKTIAYKNLIVATGSLPVVPPIPGLDLEGIMTSTEILDLEEIPKELVIIGGGVIGCEFATIYQSFGTKVTVVEMLPRLIPNMDEALSAELKKSLEKSGVTVLTDTKVEEVKKDGKAFEVSVNKDPKSVKAEKVLVAIGRKANFAGLDEVDLKGDRALEVNDKLQTSVKNIYAVGDVTGKIQLAHLASAQGMIAAENAMGEDKTMRYDIVPSCLYTIPEIASVGMTEEEAKKHKDVTVGNFPLVASGKAMAMGETQGFVKIIADKKYDEILGVHIVGPHATELINEAAAAMQLESTVEELGNVIHAHPTLSESIMEAAHDVHGKCIHKPK